MARGSWGQGPIRIGGGGEGIRLPQIPNLSARRPSVDTQNRPVVDT